MSFNKLMQHAHSIQKKAAARANKEAEDNVKHGGAFNVAAMTLQYFDYIPAMFEPFSKMPDPAKYYPLLADLEAAMHMVMTESTPVTALSEGIRFNDNNMYRITSDNGYLGRWSGDAAEAFTRNFLSTFDMVAGNQFTALSGVRGVLRAHQAMWKNAREDIDRIAHNTLDAFDVLDGCGKADASFAFSTASAMATVLSAIVTAVTGGATAPITMISAMAALGSAGVAENSASNARGSIAGQDCASILKSMEQSINRLTETINEVETDIARRVSNLNGQLNKYKGDNNHPILVSSRPLLTTMNDNDLIGNHGMGQPR